MQSIFENQIKYLKLDWDVKTLEGAQRLKNVSTGLFEELGIEKCSDAVFLKWLLMFAHGYAFLYKLIVEESRNPLDPDASWRFVFNLMQSYMQG